MTPESAGRTRAASRRHHRTSSKHHSVDLDASKYIEHLEAELAALQTQLSAMTSPTVLQARSQKMRALNTEIRGLQEEVAEWEAKFHTRVQEEVEERNQIEASLKARIRSLENDSEEHVQKVRDLQIQLEASLANNAQAETANDEMEKRIDAFSDLITSPKKIDLDRFPSSARRRHNRNKSALPRFPTTGSLAFSIKPHEQAIPTTPHPAATRGLEQAPSGFDFLQQNDIALAALTSAASDDGIPHSAILSDPPSGSSVKRWSTPEAFTMMDGSMLPSTGKHPRRMRRFHATNMPKPLLLPSTASGIHNVPSSAPPMERHESPASFPFPTLPEVSEIPTLSNYDMFMSPLPTMGRRRARTSADGIELALRETSSPFLAAITPETSSSERKVILSSPAAGDSDDTPREYSSLGSAVGRNLLEELERAKDVNSTVTSDLASELRQASGGSDETEKPSRESSPRSTSQQISSHGSQGLRRRAWTCHQRSLSDQTGLPLGDRHCQHDGLDDSVESQEEQRFWSFLPALWRQLHNTARQSLQYAQSVTLRSNTVQKLQWWLVQLFLGPQVTRRMMASSMGLPRRSIDSSELRDLSITPTRRASSKQTLAAELDMFSAQAIRRSERRFDASSQRNEWLTRHSLWTWMRFSLTMAFAVGAAIRDGPAAVMGEEDTRNA